MAGTTNPAAAQRWPAQRVHALAPDASSQRAGAKLAVPTPWSGWGARAESGLVWGDCKGSDNQPYQVTVELPGGQSPPSYSCSCPSRKLPCKHALGLLLLWSGGAVPETDEPPRRVLDWLAARRERAERGEARKAAAAQKAQAAELEDPAAARKAAQAAERRAEQRIRRIDAGVDELELWLCDQVRSGLTGLRAAGYRPIDELARRLVDAQAPGLAARVRDLTSCLNAPQDWPERTLAEFSLLYLLVQGWRNRDALPDALAATVRRRIGLNPSSAQIAQSGERAAGRWLVLGCRDTTADKLVERRVWLQREADGRVAMLLAFAPPGQALNLALSAGEVLDAELAFAPEAAPLRAVVIEQGAQLPDQDGSAEQQGAPDCPPRDASTRLAWTPQGGTLDEAAAAFAAALAADPWTRFIPFVLGSALPLPADATGAWRIADAKGGGHVSLLPETGDGTDPNRAEQIGLALLACGGGHPSPLFGLYRPAGLTPVSVWRDGEATNL
ncbi:SWIM zinc finger family protein [Actinocrinis puniceicyclus]|uniref:SWIM zinc finger family protein n=1 Tax=Actinocrinis puniceicyclus TaxID=977794 RepID=A0A8J8BA53_9ACTN|nr:SWIM zinc finger family protein [Actinocrinis puniceicyclus]MBS2961718.1 SWIM zinc finger family protein [Actinocrinis puniceicyclus]